MDLSNRLFRLAAELGDLHLHRRGPTRQLAEIDALIASKEAAIDVTKQLLNDSTAEVRAAATAAAAPPALPDIPEPKEGGPDAALPAPVDAAPDGPAATG